MCLAQGYNAVMRVRLKPATPQSQDKHSTQGWAVETRGGFNRPGQYSRSGQY